MMFEISARLLDYPFIGREQFLKTLAENWIYYRIFGVYGTRSVGKSRTVKEFILTLQKQRGSHNLQIIDVNLSTIQSLRQLKLVLLSSCGIVPNVTEAGDLHNDVLEQLSAFFSDRQSKQCILLFDNAEDVVEGDFCSEFLSACGYLIKSCPNLNVMITSTTRVNFTQIRRAYFSVELPGMSFNDGLRLLYSTAHTIKPTGNKVKDRETRAHLEKIVELCAGLPLALLMVAAELDEDSGLLKPGELVTLLMESRLQALSREFYPEDDRIADVYKKFIHRLTDVFQDRLAVLNFIPGTFRAKHATKLLGHSSEANSKHETLIPIRRRHMLQYDSDSERFDIHGILRDCLSVYVTIKNLPAVRKTYCEVFTEVMKELSEQMDTVEYTEALVEFTKEHPNLHKLLGEVLYTTFDTYPMFVEMATSCSSLIARFFGEESTEFYECCLKLTDQYSKFQDKAVVQVAYGGAITENLADFPKAEEHFCQAISILEHEPISAHLVQAYQRYGWSLANQGRAVEALGFLEQALEVGVKLGMHQDRVILATLNCLGIINTFVGNFADGEKYNKESIQRWTRKVGSADHPSVGACHNNLGITYDQMGYHKEALFHFNQGLEIKRRTKAADKSIAISLNNVANQYSNTGSFRNAIELLDEALRMLDKTPKLFQNIRSLTMLNYGKVFLKQMRYQEAIIHLQESVSMNKNNQPSHICLFESLMHLAEAYFGIENYAEVLRTLEDALSHRQQSNKEMPQNVFVLRCLEIQIDTRMKIGDHCKLHDSYVDSVSETDRLISVFMSHCNLLKCKEMEEKSTNLTIRVRSWCESHHPDCVYFKMASPRDNPVNNGELMSLQPNPSTVNPEKAAIRESGESKPFREETILERENPVVAQRIKEAIIRDTSTGKVLQNETGEMQPYPVSCESPTRDSINESRSHGDRVVAIETGQSGGIPSTEPSTGFSVTESQCQLQACPSLDGPSIAAASDCHNEMKPSTEISSENNTMNQEQNTRQHVQSGYVIDPSERTHSSEDFKESDSSKLKEMNTDTPSIYSEEEKEMSVFEKLVDDVRNLVFPNNANDYTDSIEELLESSDNQYKPFMI